MYHPQHLRHTCLTLSYFSTTVSILFFFTSVDFSYPIFENPYPMMIHESPVTCCEYLADCPVDLIPALYSVGSRQKRQGYSKKVQHTCTHSFKGANRLMMSFKLKHPAYTHTLAFEWLDYSPSWIAPLPYACVTSGPAVQHIVSSDCVGQRHRQGYLWVWKKSWPLSQDWSVVCKLWVCLPQGAG